MKNDAVIKGHFTLNKEDKGGLEHMRGQIYVQDPVKTSLGNTIDGWPTTSCQLLHRRNYESRTLCNEETRCTGTEKSTQSTLTLTCLQTCQPSF